MLSFINNFFHVLSKKASRKNLYRYINDSFLKIYKLKLNKKIKVLNIGSGGEIENLIKNNFKNIYSIDVDQKRSPDQILDICDKNFLKKIAFTPNVVCIFEVLEHTIDPHKAVQNIYKLLKKNDFCLASVPFNFHIHDEPNDFFRFTYYGTKLLFKKFSKVNIYKRNGWLESIFVNLIRLEKEKNIFSKIIGKIFIILYFLFFPIILLIQKIIISDKITTGYFIEATK